MKTWKASLLLDPQCELAEGPLWHPVDQKLYWVDILSKRLHRLDLESKRHEIHDFPMFISALGPLKDGGLIIGTEENIFKYNFDNQDTNEITKLESHIPTNRTNDGKCGPLGNFWVGTMSKTALPEQGTLYRLASDSSIQPILENCTISNGLTWSLDHQTMYYIDSPTQVVRAFDFDLKTGEITNPKVVIDLSPLPGTPDGMTIDTEGMLWIAHWGGFKVGRWNPTTGEMIGMVELPVPRVTCPVFGGPNMDTLFITTAWEHMTAKERAAYPLSGAIFSVHLPYQGRSAFYFGE